MNPNSTSSTAEIANSEILIVDDTPNNLRLLSDMLSDRGYEVRKAIDGQMALTSARVDPPDLILLDIVMPDIDGYQVCQKLKSDAKTRQIPVIFLSALDDPLDKVKAFQVGGIDYITKPFQIEEVLVRVRSQLTLRYLTQNLEAQVAKRTAELTQALHDLQEAQLQIVQAEKMATLGQLVSGIAHEINNPIGFIEGNLTLVDKGVNHLLEHLQLYQKFVPNPSPEIEASAEQIELEYLVEELPEMLESMKLGTDRIRQLSVSLRKFSRRDDRRQVAANLHDGIDSTLVILKHRLKANKYRPEIQIIKKYGNLPPVKCYPNQLNQVFMNLLANSIDAIDELGEGRSYAEMEKGSHHISIRTGISPDRTKVAIEIADNGPGMPPEVRERIFDRLYTTKPPGKGMGLGLSISHQIVTEKHHGRLRCSSTLGEGTKFTIEIPVES
ncbi:MAG TPA: response regulator [Oscillatoriales cyanobacterium M59_W2019_021]|nr:MAG: hybrid sensor histidine kinase/response regulator [Cyanobacteria bacterium J055]HIK50819.1 response regulator [Oscillatoriales cyanobacterium M59_W2019_021]